MGVARLITRVVEFFYLPLLRPIVSLQVFRYGAVGVLNMLLDALWYFLIYNFVVCKQNVDLGFIVVSPHIFSLVIVFPITFFTGFWLNRNVAFRATRFESLPQLARYALTVVGAILLNYISMKLLVEYLMLWPTPSKIVTTAVTACYSYLLGRYYTFASTDGDNDDKA